MTLTFKCSYTRLFAIIKIWGSKSRRNCSITIDIFQQTLKALQALLLQNLYNKNISNDAMYRTFDERYNLCNWFLFLLKANYPWNSLLRVPFVWTSGLVEDYQFFSVTQSTSDFSSRSLFFTPVSFLRLMGQYRPTAWLKERAEIRYIYVRVGYVESYMKRLMAMETFNSTFLKYSETTISWLCVNYARVWDCSDCVNLKVIVP